DAKAIDVAKAVAKAQIEALPNLTREEKDAYQKQIDEATNGTDIKNIVDAAKKADAAKSTETEAQKAGKDAVDGFDTLTDEEKQGYKDRIDATTDPATIISIVREAGRKAIDNATNLTPDQKNAAKDAINNGGDASIIGDIVDRYTDMQSALERAKKLLDEATTVREGANYTGASAELKKAYDDAIAALQAKYDAAVAGDSTVSAIELNQYSDKVDETRNALTPSTDGTKSGSSSSKIPWWVYLLTILGIGGGVLGWGYVHDADFRAVVDGAIANFQRGVDDARANIERALGIRR
ncbi:MAG: GA module-containing protein, partial [Corynebacterium sp.]|nr:GA module-containing protein [Corynebacterium sp.]